MQYISKGILLSVRRFTNSISHRPQINHVLITEAIDSKEVKMSNKEIKEAERLLKNEAGRADGEGSCILKFDITPL